MTMNGRSSPVSPTSYIAITFGSPERLAAVRASRRNRAWNSGSVAHRSASTLTATVRPRISSVAR